MKKLLRANFLPWSFINRLFPYDAITQTLLTSHYALLSMGPKKSVEGYRSMLSFHKNQFPHCFITITNNWHNPNKKCISEFLENNIQKLKLFFLLVSYAPIPIATYTFQVQLLRVTTFMHRCWRLETISKSSLPRPFFSETNTR